MIRVLALVALGLTGQPGQSVCVTFTGTVVSSARLTVDVVPLDGASVAVVEYQATGRELERHGYVLEQDARELMVTAGEPLVVRADAVALAPMVEGNAYAAATP